ncbi:MAG: hypothetical protein ABJN34_06725 [Litoreibacter sp.]|uniref:MotE family protein n=1 Tax=Litoreibacter sp. TaxID=1969459 RepID=UPI0032990E94
MMKITKSKTTIRGILAFIITMLLFSGSIRLGTIGIAVASINPTDDPVALTGTHASCTTDAETERLMAILKERSKELDELEEQQVQRQANLDQARAEISKNLALVEEAERQLSQTITRVGDASSNDVTQLTAVYQSMKPKDAAALFEQMSPDFAAGFLSGMSPAAAAGILSGLSSEKAYAVSVVLAGRNANAPTQ